jgi:hypothetical protein
VGGPWHCHLNPIASPIVDDAEQLRHLIQLPSGVVNKWSNAEVGYLLFFHIRWPRVNNLERNEEEGQPVLIRASVYHLQPHDGQQKPVKRVASFADSEVGGKASLIHKHFQDKVTELLKEKGFTLPEDLPAGRKRKGGP